MTAIAEIMRRLAAGETVDPGEGIRAPDEPLLEATLDPDRYHMPGSEDDEQAAWLAVDLKHEVRYDHGHARWHVYDPASGIWHPDRKQEVEERVRRLARARIGDIALAVRNTKAMAQTIKNTRRLLEGNRVRSALQVLAWRDDYKTDGNDWDQDPNLLGCANGIVDLRTGDFVKTDPAWLVSRSTGIVYDPEATCLTFIKFLEEVTSDRDGNPQPLLATYLMQVFGAALFGHVKPQQFWVLIGPGGAGKGTLVKAVAHAFGVNEYSVFPDRTLYKEQPWEPGSDRARPDFLQLQGRRLAYISEPASPFNDELLKNHSGDDHISARHMRSDKQLSWQPTHTIVFSTNSAPPIKDVGESMKRRLRVVPFVRTFGSHPDDTLGDRLKAEAPGILALLVRAAVEYSNDTGILLDRERAPQVVQLASARYIEDNDPMAAFVEACCVFAPELKTEFLNLYDAYTQWFARAQGTGELSGEASPMSKQGLGIALAQRNLERRKSNSRVFWHGIGLRET